jgi:hypothetical protein
VSVRSAVATIIPFYSGRLASRGVKDSRQYLVIRKKKEDRFDMIIVRISNFQRGAMNHSTNSEN